MWSLFIQKIVDITCLNRLMQASALMAAASAATGVAWLGSRRRSAALAGYIFLCSALKVSLIPATAFESEAGSGNFFH
jgi:hypothetical protein